MQLSPGMFSKQRKGEFGFISGIVARGVRCRSIECVCTCQNYIHDVVTQAIWLCCAHSIFLLEVSLRFNIIRSMQAFSLSHGCFFERKFWRFY